MDKARLAELAARADKTGRAYFTPFLDPSEQDEARVAAKKAGVCCAFEGGYELAERRACAFFVGDAPESFPVSAVDIRWNEKYASVTHRDLLGAAMHLGFERERMGDLVVRSDFARLFLAPELVSYVIDGLDRAGRASLSVSEADDAPIDPEADGVPVRGTVPSLRLDAMLAAGFDMSRSEASERVRKGLVRLNFRETLKPDAEMREGDLISVRGMGRLRFTLCEGETKKGRIGVRFLRFGS